MATESPAELTFTHYAPNLVDLDRARTYDQAKDAVQDFVHKPAGLWLSVDGEVDWRTWADEAEFSRSVRCAHTVTLSSHANLLVIDTAEALEAFVDEYGTVDGITLGSSRIEWVKFDFVRLATEFDGILILAGLREYKSPSDWYALWDVSSACVWSLDAIATFESRGARGPATPCAAEGCDREATHDCLGMIFLAKCDFPTCDRHECPEHTPAAGPQAEESRSAHDGERRGDVIEPAAAARGNHPQLTSRQLDDLHVAVRHLGRALRAFDRAGVPAPVEHQWWLVLIRDAERKLGQASDTLVDGLEMLAANGSAPSKHAGLPTERSDDE